MRILMLTASLPYPPHQGGAIRAYGILQGLYNAGHSVTLLSFQDGEHPIEKTPLAECCEAVITVPTPHRAKFKRLYDLLFTGQADIARRLESDAMHRRLANLLDDHTFDLIQFEGIEVANYLFAVQAIQPDIPTIYDAFNAEAALQKVIADIDRGDLRRLPSSLYSSIQSTRIRGYEASLMRAATAVIAVSDEDANLLRKHKTDTPVYVVPSGIFVADYANDIDRLELRHNALVFTGKMDYRPNVDAMSWFAKQVLPRITAEQDAHLYIVGQKPHERLNALRAIPDIEITGWVPEIQPYLHAADVYVAPLRMGSGTRLKILEAMASGCAVVATSIAASGLMESAQQHMMIADAETAMADAVLELLQYPEKRRALGDGAHTYIKNHYDWSVIIPRLLDMYKDIGLEQVE